MYPMPYPIVISVQDKPHYILEAAKRGLTEVTKTMLFVDKELVKEHDKVHIILFITIFAMHEDYYTYSSFSTMIICINLTHH